MWFEPGIGNEVLEQSEETKLQCVVKTTNDPSTVNGVSCTELNSCGQTAHPSFALITGTIAATCTK